MRISLRKQKIALRKKVLTRSLGSSSPSKSAQSLEHIAGKPSERSIRITGLETIPLSMVPFQNVSQYEAAFLRAADHAFEFAKIAPVSSKSAKIYFVAPVLPHTTVLDVWNLCTQSLGMAGTVLSAEKETASFQQYVNYANAQGFSVSLELKTLETADENRTFLAGIDDELKQAKVVVALGETSLSTYQTMKHCRNHLKRFVVWQNAPRPLQTLPTTRQGSGFMQPAVAREKSLRKEILKACDVLVCFDKESATLAYLEGVSAQRIRRLSRGILLDRYCEEFRKIHRTEIRKCLGIGEEEIVFLQTGPLEVESGVFDTLFAFKSLLQSLGSKPAQLKIVCCGQGSAGADVRQMVVDLGLDDLVFFLSQSDLSEAAVRGDHLSHLIAVADVVIHNPVCPTSGEPFRFLDCTSDVLCAVSYGIPVISNGFGWVGEWLSRFVKNFSPGNIHSQARAMRDSFEKKPRIEVAARSARKALENDLRIESTAADLAKILKGLTEEVTVEENTDLQNLFEVIEKSVKSQAYVDAINNIEAAFKIPGLKASQQAWLFRTVGDCFTRLGDLESGQQNYLRAAELDPYCHRVYIGLGTVALQAKQYNVAVPHFHKAISLAPKDDMANLGLGLAFEGLGETQQSLHWTLKACQINMENKPALYHLVKLSHELSDYDDAIQIIEKYVNVHPYDVHMVYTLGGLLYKCEQIEMAQSLMESILKIDPMNNLAHSLLSQINREAKSKVAKNSQARS